MGVTDFLRELQNSPIDGFNGCTRLTSVDGLKALKNLQTLDLIGCKCDLEATQHLVQSFFESDSSPEPLPEQLYSAKISTRGMRFSG